jgi:SAM-dependent methyltransferase
MVARAQAVHLRRSFKGRANQLLAGACFHPFVSELLQLGVVGGHPGIELLYGFASRSAVVADDSPALVAARRPCELRRKVTRGDLHGNGGTEAVRMPFDPSVTGLVALSSRTRLDLMRLNELKRSLDSVGLLRPAFRIVEAMRGRFNREYWAGYPGGIAPDGLPIPTPHLAALVGHSTAQAFLDAGRDIAECIREVLALHGVQPEGFGRILDFGCGCGRVLRNWRSLAETEVHGCDYNPELVRWCERNLLFAHSRANAVHPPVAYPSDHFDLIYSFSVFTHLPEELQQPWIDELRRITRGGGYVLITTSGASYASILTNAEGDAFNSGRLVVRYGSVAGTNLCAAFHPPAYVRDTLAKAFEVLHYSPTRTGQDFILLRKPAGTQG